MPSLPSSGTAALRGLAVYPAASQLAVFSPTSSRSRGITNASAEARLSSGSRKLQHFRYKFARVERREVVDLFAGADEARGNFQFVLNCNHDSAFAAAVEFGHDQPR